MKIEVAEILEKRFEILPVVGVGIGPDRHRSSLRSALPSHADVAVTFTGEEVPAWDKDFLVMDRTP
ncbi:MAG: hypothetical protein NVSMB21_13750 [Vulcanimicrobiaceae bacterium]